MSVQPVNESLLGVDVSNGSSLRPELSLVLGFNDKELAGEGTESRAFFDAYYDARQVALQIEKPKGEVLQGIHRAASSWAEKSGSMDIPEDQESLVAYYSNFDRKVVEKRLGSFVNFLRQEHRDEVPEEDLVATELFIESAFAMFEDQPAEGKEVLNDANGSFAFVVPTRMSRKYAEYGQEVEPIIPALRYLPNEMRSRMMVGLPPFVIDTYAEDAFGKRGFLVLAPVYEDIRQDIEAISDQVNLSVKNVNAAVDFAYRRFGVGVVGLGATLPALTMYGKKITNPQVITTTGHGGTAELIAQTLESGLNAKGRQLKSIGVLGMGAIGASVAQVLVDRYPDAKFNVYDTANSRAEKVAMLRPDRFDVMKSDADLVAESQIVISAITGRFDTTKVKTMVDKIVVDDAQPGSFDPEAVEALGGKVLWVIGKDPTGHTARRSGYDYATMLDPNTDVFGCEAEAASIARYKSELERRVGAKLAERIAGKVAIKHAVDMASTRRISALFKKYGIVASEPQAFGVAVNLG